MEQHLPLCTPKVLLGAYFQVFARAAHCGCPCTSQPAETVWVRSNETQVQLYVSQPALGQIFQSLTLSSLFLTLLNTVKLWGRFHMTVITANLHNSTSHKSISSRSSSFLSLLKRSKGEERSSGQASIQILREHQVEEDKRA